MHPDQIIAITQSFQPLLLHEDMLVALFYERLFVLEPAAKAIFGSDMRAQGRKFMDMVHILVAGLHDLDMLSDRMHELGQRHRAYGVCAEQYATVQAALLWALQQTLNDQYTIEVEQAWTALYDLVASTMQEAAAR